MNKTDLIGAVSDKAEVTKKEAEKIINAVFATITDTLAANEKVQLVGFGTFEVRERAARVGRNPQTGESIDIAATRVPTFKAGKGLKDAVAK